MKKGVLVLAVLFGAAHAFAQAPDLRDSIILESKTVAPSTGPEGMVARVLITNKDTLGSIALALAQRSLTGGAYATLAYPRIYGGFLRRFTSTLGQQAVVTNRYNSSSADSFFFYLYTLYGEFELPNPTRKAFVEMKFDTVKPEFGRFELDTIRHPPSLFTVFGDKNYREFPVHFLKATITVARKGDLNLDAELRPADLVWCVNCVMAQTPPPAGFYACDVNCDGARSIADVVLTLRAVFREEELPC